MGVALFQWECPYFNHFGVPKPPHQKKPWNLWKTHLSLPKLGHFPHRFLFRIDGEERGNGAEEEADDRQTWLPAMVGTMVIIQS